MENQHKIKRFYNGRDVSKRNGHAWNRVNLGNKRKFFVDTTFMSGARIGDNAIKPGSSFKHKYDVKNRKKQNKVNTDIDDFFFDFTPQEEVNEHGMLHLMDKFIH